jgi:hypothetical protein
MASMRQQQASCLLVSLVTSLVISLLVNEYADNTAAVFDRKDEQNEAVLRLIDRNIFQ